MNNGGEGGVGERRGNSVEAARGESRRRVDNGNARLTLARRISIDFLVNTVSAFRFVNRYVAHAFGKCSNTACCIVNYVDLP